MADDHTVTVSTPSGVVRVTSPRPPSRRARTRAEAHRRFVLDHWAELSAAAFAGYRRHGAGAVVLWREAPPRRLRPRPFEPERLWYTTQIHAIPGTTAADFDGWEARQLETYDPRAEGIVVIVEGGGLAGYRVAGDLAPPDALRRSTAGTN